MCHSATLTVTRVGNEHGSVIAAVGGLQAIRCAKGWSIHFVTDSFVSRFALSSVCYLKLCFCSAAACTQHIHSVHKPSHCQVFDRLVTCIKGFLHITGSHVESVSPATRHFGTMFLPRVFTQRVATTLTTDLKKNRVVDDVRFHMYAQRQSSMSSHHEEGTAHRLAKVCDKLAPISVFTSLIFMY